MKVGDLVRSKCRTIIDVDPNESLQYIRKNTHNHDYLGIILKVHHGMWYSEACVYFPTIRSACWRDMKGLKCV